jgi:hypothetical protein
MANKQWYHRAVRDVEELGPKKYLVGAKKGQVRNDPDSYGPTLEDGSGRKSQESWETQGQGEASARPQDLYESGWAADE